MANALDLATHALDWKRFVGLAEAEARTEPGRAKIAALIDSAYWAPDLSSAQYLQHETFEVSSLLDREGLWGPLTELQTPTTQLEHLKRGSVLELAELVVIRGWVYAIDSWSQTPRDEIRGELFKKALGQLPDPFEALRTLDRVLTPEGELSEKASPRLSQLHAEIRALKREIGIVLDQLVKTFSQKGVLQENFSDVRDGRFVIPVKISSQGEVDGIIYEASASRQTVFVEPREISPLNNRLRKLQNDLIQEVYLILQETSKRLQPFAEELELGVALIIRWDAIQARARLGRRYAGKQITVTSERSFRLKDTAHPLLWWAIQPETIIRNVVDFGDPTRTLLITGPNTGGKTVLLKTLGLAGLCARTGFLFPAIEQPRVPFFDGFFADLGDPQSIEAHLSSFSGHVLRFKQILENITPQSLVLIDELNSATDPEEGAALGRAFLEAVMEHGALLVTTTHDPQLKAVAVSDSRIMNASMEFDEAARTPTYTMVLGVPGRSRALETAERLGMPAAVLERARSYLSREHREFEAMLSKLQQDSHEAAKARKEALHLKEEAERLKREWTDRTEANVDHLMERTRHKLRHILEQAQDEVRASVRKLDEMRTRRELDQTRGKLNETLQFTASRIDSALAEEAPEIAHALSIKQKEKTAAAPDTLPLEVGTPVRIPKWKATGTVLEIAGGKAKVAMGTIQMSLSLSDIQALTAGEIAALPKSRDTQGTSKKALRHEVPAAPPPQIDLRGIRLDEAMSELERYLDQAYRSGSRVEVTIVHGLGTGAIREGARKILKDLPYVRAVRDGGVGQGGAGATIVEFERD